MTTLLILLALSGSEDTNHTTVTGADARRMILESRVQKYTQIGEQFIGYKHLVPELSFRPSRRPKNRIFYLAFYPDKATAILHCLLEDYCRFILRL